MATAEANLLVRPLESGGCSEALGSTPQAWACRGSTACCAQTKGIGNADRGGYVACCEGRKVACTQQAEPSSAPGGQIIFDCIKVHEEAHFPDVDCPPCRGGECPDCDVAVFRHSNNQGRGECAASVREVVCLRDNKHKCNGNPQCELNVDNRIAQMVDYGNGFGFNCGLN